MTNEQLLWRYFCPLKESKFKVLRILLSLFLLLMSPTFGLAQSPSAFSLNEMEEDVYRILPKQLNRPAHLLLKGENELILFNTCPNDEENKELINFISRNFPRIPLTKLVITSNHLAKAMGVPYLKKLNSGLQVFSPPGFDNFKANSIQKYLSEYQQRFESNELEAKDFIFKTLEVSQMTTLIFNGRRAELQAERNTWCSASLLTFISDSKSLYAFEYFNNKMDVGRALDINILNWQKSLNRWKNRCPSRVLGGTRLEEFTTFSMNLFSKELKKVLDNYLEAINDGLSADDFIASYEKANFKIELLNGKNTLFFLYQQIKRNARAKKPVDRPDR